MDESPELKHIPDRSCAINADQGDAESASQVRIEQKRFEQALEFAPDACLVTDDAGVIRQANSAAVALLKTPKSHLLAKPLIEFVTPEARPAFPGNLVHSIPEPVVRIFRSEIQPEANDPFSVLLRVTPLTGPTPDHPNFMWLVRGIAPRSFAAEQVGDKKAVQVLDEIGSELGSKPNRRSRLKTIADRIKILFQAHSLVIYLYDAERGELELEIAKGLPTIPGTHIRVGEGMFGMVAQDRQPMLVENFKDWPFMEPHEDQPLSAVLAPMLCFDEMVGVMAVARTDTSDREYDLDDVRLLSIFASLAALIVHAMRAQDGVRQERANRKQVERELKITLNKVQTLQAKIEVIREEERKHLARQIHDDLGQLLTGFKLDLGWLAKNQQAILEKSQSLLKLSDSTIESVQRISSELRPGVLDELGLVRALEWQAEAFQERYGIECGTNLQVEEENLDRNLSTAVFRILQEALTNVARHARATRICIELKEERGHLLLTIEDNGCGIAESQAKSLKSLGLVGMRERAQAFGGKVDVTGAPGQGTIVTARFPLRNLTVEAAK